MPTGNSAPLFPPFPPLPLQRSARAPGVVTAEDQFLAAVQGNILKGHGRDQQRLVFFRFTGRESGRRSLRAAVSIGQLGRDRWVCSAREQRLQREEAHTGDASGLLFGSVLLSLAGLQFLGLNPPDSEAFRAGMKARMAAMLEPGEMEAAPYHPADDFHGGFLLACDDPAELERHLGNFSAWARAFELELLPAGESALAWRESTSPYGNGYCPPREPFGFADGISQPRFFSDQRPPAGPEVGRTDAWHWTDLQLADVFIASGEHTGGSLVALLKIEQKVATFRAYEAEIARLLAAHLNLPAETAAYLAPAVIMGRTRQGYPLPQILGRLTPRETDLRALFPADPRAAPGTPPEMPAWLNEFDFESRDPAAGGGCPFHLHVRKMNPRTTNLPDQGTRETFVRAQPVRRGAAYDPKGLLAAAESAGGVNWPDREVGLLFLAYMGSLERQFEQAHTHWSRDATFAGRGGVDPVLAQPDPSQQSVPMTFNGVPLPAMPKVLQRLGGAYLYAPSILWLGRVSP